ncbi:hypothetical protein [Halococcus saccharolyticus]|uniref:hypothetical protein n=1 Tax=Halococcus saccharolyticus TaxID=62319 RepID=UPI0006779FC6|nr:hypothetical protein [Halococcus saccharolyticus]
MSDSARAAHDAVEVPRWVAQHALTSVQRDGGEDCPTPYRDENAAAESILEGRLDSGGSA